MKNTSKRKTSKRETSGQIEKRQPFVGSSSFLGLKLESFVICLISSSHSFRAVKFTGGIIEKKFLRKFSFIETSV